MAAGALGQQMTQVAQSLREQLIHLDGPKDMDSSWEAAAADREPRVVSVLQALGPSFLHTGHQHPPWRVPLM
ncbi:hypothetical protein H8959_004202 [Pygathrix nigripes]